MNYYKTECNTNLGPAENIETVLKRRPSGHPGSEPQSTGASQASEETTPPPVTPKDTPWTPWQLELIRLPNRL